MFLITEVFRLWLPSSMRTNAVFVGFMVR